MEVLEQVISCPYCGESQTVLVDPGNIGVSYVEDCQVCCQPIVLLPSDTGQDTFSLLVTREDE
ncbi:MAG: CPXCG motif-containing cysteine-rich protein [Chromatocurvus sp.]